MKVILSILKPEQQEEIIAIDKPGEVTIGRSANSVCCLDFDPMVSRMHAVLAIDPPSVHITDLNSTNGLVINGEAFGGASNEKLVQPRELFDGDEVMIGATLISINVLDDNAEMPGIPVNAVVSVPATAAAGTSVQTESEDVGSLTGAETLANIAPMLPEIPGYRIRKYLGSGRMGTVYQGVKLDTDQNVAIKIIVPGIAFTKKMLDTFLSEFAIARKISHPNIIKLIDAGAIGDRTMFLVLEYVNGEDLASYLHRAGDHRMRLRDAYVVMLQVTSALSYAHELGYVHRDVKPGSIMLYDANGALESKLTDLGLAKCFEDSGIVRPTDVLSNESLAYMPPEQVVEFRDIKPSVDVFSIAAVFYEMISGHTPYNFDDDGGTDRMATVANGDIIPIEERVSDLPEPLVVIIDRCLSVDPEERYRSCSDLLDALENVRV